jgi:hypothetical protein
VLEEDRQARYMTKVLPRRQVLLRQPCRRSLLPSDGDPGMGKSGNECVRGYG